MIIAVVSKKGGSGKTTCAIYLAEALTAFGTVEVHDVDPQGSATNWALLAEDEDRALDFTVTPSNVMSLKRLRRTVKTDHVIIDAPPGYPDINEAAIRAADVVVIPTEASRNDLVPVWALLEELQDKPHAVLLSRTNPRTRTYKQAVADLEAADVSRFATDIRSREGIKAAYGTHLNSNHLHGYDAVLDELIEALGADFAHAERN